MSWIDGLIIVAFVVYAIGSGLRARKQAGKNLEEYFLAGRSLKGWQAGVSMAATQFAADTPLLVTGLIAVGGIFSLWRLWVYALAFLLLGFVLGPSWRRVRVLTDAELTEVRYGKKQAAALRGIKAVYFGTIINCAVLAMVLFAATLIAEPFLKWDEWLPAWMFDPFVGFVQLTSLQLGETAVLSARNFISILAIVGVTTLYSTTGGLRSVVKTDIAQFALMMAGTALFAGIVVVKAGGFSGIHAQLQVLNAGDITPDQIVAFVPSRAKGVGTALIGVLALQWLVQFNSDGTGYLAQRTMACRTDNDARQAAVIFTGLQVVVRSLFWIALGLGLLVIFGLQKNPEATYVMGMAQLLPVGVLGLMLTGMLAALASTVDTHLNWGASYWTNDIYKRFVNPGASDRQLVWVARASNFLILAIALVVMTRIDSIETAWKLSLLLGAGIGIILVMRWLWWRMNAWGEISCIGASLVLAPVLLFGFPDAAEAVRLLVMAVGATGVGIATSLLTRSESIEKLEEFYSRAQPPGFWGPVAEAMGDDPVEPRRRLARGVGAMMTCSLSMFCVLTAVGSALAFSPPPVWFPWRWAWITLCALGGLALVPAWLQLGFSFSLSAFLKSRFVLFPVGVLDE